jgi:DNA-binding GntR family transcriptional regulator
VAEHSNGSATKAAPRAHTELAYDSIKDGITSGVLAPGEWLREYTVASSLGLSRTPVREALRVLAAEGIVELEHNRGARVIGWTSEDIDEVYRLRALLEGYGATLAARHATADQLTELRRVEDNYEQAVQSGKDSAVTSAECNNAFHAAVLAASGSGRLATLVAVVSSAPLVHRARRHYTDDDQRRSVVQHRDIITAIQNRDEPLAQTAMSSHILAARYTALRVANSGGG